MNFVQEQLKTIYGVPPKGIGISADLNKNDKFI